MDWDDKIDKIKTAVGLGDWEDINILVVFLGTIGGIVAIVFIVKYIKRQQQLNKPPPPTTTIPQTTQPPTLIQKLETDTRLQYIIAGSVIAVIVLVGLIAYFATARRKSNSHKIRRPEYARQSYSYYK